MLYDRDFKILTKEEKAKWEKAKEYKLEKIKKALGLNPKQLSKFHELMPDAAYHYESIFPNNYLNIKHLKDVEYLKNLNNIFENLLNTNPGEREILNFISFNKAYFLIGSIMKSSFNFGHHAAFAFKEFALPPNFIADYLLIGKNSGGYEFIFVELESPTGAIVNSDGTFGATIRKGIKQIEDWDAWIESNFAHLVLLFQKHQGLHKALPTEFLQLDKSRIHYSIVAGRRNDFKEKTYRAKRKLLRERNILLLHYDNLIDGTKLFYNSGNY
ncbi:DUF4263 domain-containing protein [bacterium]|nr:MAG: DUF4263 domain-containing protein [bacterium]